MKKVISTMALFALLFSMNINAQEKQEKKVAKAKTEKASVATEKKSCSMGEKKACCVAKKMEEKK